MPCASVTSSRSVFVLPIAPVFDSSASSLARRDGDVQDHRAFGIHRDGDVIGDLELAVVGREPERCRRPAHRTTRSSSGPRRRRTPPFRARPPASTCSRSPPGGRAGRRRRPSPRGSPHAGSVTCRSGPALTTGALFPQSTEPVRSDVPSVSWNSHPMSVAVPPAAAPSQRQRHEPGQLALRPRDVGARRERGLGGHRVPARPGHELHHVRLRRARVEGVVERLVLDHQVLMGSEHHVDAVVRHQLPHGAERFAHQCRSRSRRGDASTPPRTAGAVGLVIADCTNLYWLLVGPIDFEEFMSMNSTPP